MCIRAIQLTEENTSCSLADTIIDRYCSFILPQIVGNIECLTVEPVTMERIFRSGEYSRLCQLTLLSRLVKSLYRDISLVISVHYSRTKEIY